MEFQEGLEHHVAGTCTRLLLDHVAAKAGQGAVAAVLELAGEPRPERDLREDTTWSSYAQFRALTEAAAAVLGSPRCFDDMYATVSLVEGSMPEATEMLQALGSPGTLFRTMEHGNGIVSFMSGAGLLEEVSDTEWNLGYRLFPGFEIWPEFCSFWNGMNGMTPKLFGFAVEEVTETACALEGDDHCTFRVRWSDAGEESELERLRMKVALLESRAEAFRETVTNLVSDEDLATILQRTVESAAGAMRAPAFVLALDPLPWNTERIFVHGMPLDDGRRAAQMLLDPDAMGEEDASAVVVDVESTKRRYGRLAAIDPLGAISATDLPVLRSYARLAATALDSAMALEESRRQATSAGALLALAWELAEVTSTEEMAANVARATPMVIDCDTAAVVLIDDDGVARVRGVRGFPRDIERYLLSLGFPVDDRLIRDFRLYTVESAYSELRSVMQVCGSEALATVPIIIDGGTAGSLVVAVGHDARRLVDNPEVKQQLRGLAAQASTALRNARLLDEIRHQALHDALTGLPNRALVLDRTEHLLARARRSHSTVAALFIDLDGFKDVNDTLGHAAGDQLLKAVAARLSAAARESDTIARLGGDEFIVLTETTTLDAGPELVAQRILDVLREPFHVEGRESPLRVGASIGIAAGDRATPGELLRDADVALYEAKASGKGCYVSFAPEMHTAITDRMTLEMDLQGGLERGEFFLVYQPIVDLRDETITAVEALLRWRHPQRGVVQPDRFIPILEDSGMIHDVGRWVLLAACQQTAQWHAAGHPIDISVNVSARQLDHDRLLDDIRAALAGSGLPATSLILEITETTIMRDAEATVRRLQQLKDLGIRIAIDDFGTGYSSLAYLRQFPVDSLKIDRSFISAISELPESDALIHTLVQLGKTLGLTTLAEGIEDRYQLDRLQHENCDSGQGFLFARPLDSSDLARLLDAHRGTPAVT